MKNGNGTRAVKCRNGMGIPFHKTGFAYKYFLAIHLLLTLIKKICKCLTLKLTVPGLVTPYVRSDEDEMRVIIMGLE